MTDDLQQVIFTRPPHSNPVAKILVSGCLNGPPIRFNQTNVEVRSPIWNRWVSEGRLVPFCAELAAGFQVPRPPAETVGGDGKAVLRGKATVLEDTGQDVTNLFTKGAELAISHALNRVASQLFSQTEAHHVGPPTYTMALSEGGPRKGRESLPSYSSTTGSESSPRVNSNKLTNSSANHRRNDGSHRSLLSGRYQPRSEAAR